MLCYACGAQLLMSVHDKLGMLTADNGTDDYAQEATTQATQQGSNACDMCTQALTHAQTNKLCAM